MHIQAMFHSNYNGWSVEVNGKDPDNWDLIEDLVDYTVDHTDDDGEYFYSDLKPEHQDDLRKIIIEHYPNVLSIDFEMDRTST